MDGILERLGAVNPLVWVVIVLAAALGFGAQKWVNLMKIPEDKQLKYIVALKSGALLLAILTFILVIST